MVRGIEIFSVHFSEFSDCYALIGGSACYLILNEIGYTPRATKDLDIVLIIENFNSDFALAITDFVEKGGYKNWQSNSGRTHFFRFLDPSDVTFPYMLEIFSGVPDVLEIGDDSRYTRIPSNKDIASLSAILMDDAYYRLVRDGKSDIHGISIVKAEYLIPLKIKAWMDLADRKNEGQRIGRHDINKHRGDVFRLSAILSPALKISIGDSVSQDMTEGLNRMSADQSLNLSDFGLGTLKVTDVVDLLRSIYQLNK